MKILMAAAENDALPGGKVGGIGDVVRDIPLALAELGHTVEVVTPGYGTFSQARGAQWVVQLQVKFQGRWQPVDLFQVPAKASHNGVTHWVLEHPLFAVGGPGVIYCNDPDDRPFATDASKFALYCASVAQAIVDGVFQQLDVLHLHDWHAALVSVLRAFDPSYAALKTIHTVYTIHNLALQGVRPLRNDESSLHSWFPDLHYEPELINDPRATDCINPMRAGINLCQKIQAVSPSYAGEIQVASKPEQGYYGGEGLEADLKKAAAKGRLHGILNGCEYPEQPPPRLALGELSELAERELLQWIGAAPTMQSAHHIAGLRLARLTATNTTTQQAGKAPFVVTSVGRLTAQKVLLLQHVMEDGETALDHLLNTLGSAGVLLLLGNGDARLEQFLTRVAARRDNFIFLKGYSETLSNAVYASGDLFLMPSSFEPCGISQMLAMRAGQPCLVHGVGGLKDTVRDRKDGFVFAGDSLASQAGNMIKTFRTALNTWQKKPKTWASLAAAAAAARFTWRDAADEVIRHLYHHDSTR